MAELKRGSSLQVRQKEKVEVRTVVKRVAIFTVVAAAALLAIRGGAVLYAHGQDSEKYSLKSPSGIAFSDFKGYEDWAVASSAHTQDVLKVIAANPTMIDAYKAGVPSNGQAFPDGSRIV